MRSLRNDPGEKYNHTSRIILFFYITSYFNFKGDKVQKRVK